MFIAHPLPSDSEISDQIIIPVLFFQQLIQEFNNEDVLYVNLIHTEYNITYMVTITSTHQDDSSIIYVPDWILDMLGYSLDPIFKVEKVDGETYPVATRIVIKPLDPMAFEVDLVSHCEKALMNLHSIQQHSTIPIQLPTFQFVAYIELVEPAPLSRIVQGEIAVEFINIFEEPLIESLEENPVLEYSAEERRRQVRAAWCNRFT
jgi:hypothetical protein